MDFEHILAYNTTFYSQTPKSKPRIDRGHGHRLGKKQAYSRVGGTPFHASWVAGTGIWTLFCFAASALYAVKQTKLILGS